MFGANVNNWLRHSNSKDNRLPSFPRRILLTSPALNRIHVDSYLVWYALIVLLKLESECSPSRHVDTGGQYLQSNTWA
jgi:hypothetical protein